MYKKKSISVIVGMYLTAIIFFIVWFLLKEFILNYFVKFNLESIEPPREDSKVLIFAPHNDDEALGASAFISKTIKNGGNVKVVLVTNGDGHKNGVKLSQRSISPKPADYISFGYERQKESVKAMELIGVKKEDIIFLGYPDGGISYLWSSNWDLPYTSLYTQVNESPYTNSYSLNVKYTGRNLESDIEKIILDYKPDYIIYPHPNDRHSDHWAVNAFVNYCIIKTGYLPKEQLLYLVHRGDWPTPLKRNIKLFLVPPRSLLNSETEWYALDMDDDEIIEKGRVISQYKSQFKTLKPLLTAFERKNELFGKLPSAPINSYNNDDNNILLGDSNKIITDPHQDTFTLEASKGTDITGLFAEISTEGNFHMFIKTHGKIEKDICYSSNIIFFGDDNILRLKIDVKSKRLVVNGNTDDGSQIDVEISHETIGKYIHFIIPKEIVDKYKYIFLNAETSIREHRLDRTAYRLMELR